MACKSFLGILYSGIEECTVDYGIISIDLFKQKIDLLKQTGFH